MTVPEPDADLPTTAEPADENPTAANRRKFREALDRKQGRHGQQSSGGPQAGGLGSTSPAKTQRTFRRKSG